MWTTPQWTEALELTSISLCSYFSAFRPAWLFLLIFFSSAWDFSKESNLFLCSIWYLLRVACKLMLHKFYCSTYKTLSYLTFPLGMAPTSHCPHLAVNLHTHTSHCPPLTAPPLTLTFTVLSSSSGLYEWPLTWEGSSRRTTKSFPSLVLSFLKDVWTLGGSISVLMNTQTVKSQVPDYFMTYDFKKENEEVETLLVIWVLYSRVLVPNRLGLKFWLLPSFPVCSQQLLNFSKIHLYALICTVRIIRASTL